MLTVDTAFIEGYCAKNDKCNLNGPKAPLAAETVCISTFLVDI
jgi:hypothetical protein